MAFTEKELEVQKEYLDTLNTLNCNSKPLIDVLTDIAEESREFARVIVKCIEDQLEKVSVDLKLPLLYLIDSIIKKEQEDPVYTPLFCCKLHLLFGKVFREGKEDVRSRLLKLRITWNGILPSVILSAIDNEVRKVNPTWPSGPAVHVNPKFIPGSTAVPFVINSMKTDNISQVNPTEPTKKDILMKRQQEYLALKKKAELLERMKSQPPVKADAKNDRISTITNQIFTDAEKFKDGADNPSDIEKVRESAFAIKSSLLKSREQLIKDTGHCNHSTLNELILKLENTITELDKLIASQKANAEKNRLSRVPTTSAVSASKQNVSKSGTVPRAWLSKNSSASLHLCSKPASNGSTSVASPNPPAFRIAPVNSQLINAVARRPRDPRLRKFEEHDPKTNVSPVTTTVERKVSLASTPIDTKNDKQNDVSKIKEFVSDVTSTSVPAVSPAKAADLKTVVQVDRKNDRQSEKALPSTKIRSSPSKPSKSSLTESLKRDDSPVSKTSDASSSSLVSIKEDSLSNEAVSNIESIIPAAPSISGEKPSTSYMRDHSTKKESKPTKIRVKVVQKGTKEKFSKRTPVAPSESTALESTMPCTAQNGSKENAGEKTVPPMTREARNKKINALADVLLKMDDRKRRFFLEDLSKTHVKLAQKLQKVVKKKLTTEIAKSTVAEVPTPPAPSISTVASPIIIDELMDITDDKNDFIFVSGPNSSEAQEKSTSSTVEKFDQTGAVADVTEEISDEVDSKGETVSVLMDISEDSGEKTLLTSEVEEEIEKSAPKSPSGEMNLSQKLEAVMNATSTDLVPSSNTQDVDIRPLLPSSIGLNLNCTLPVVPDMIAPVVPLSTDPVDTSTATPFNNPFGLSQVATKDIDYRQLFGFPQPGVPTSTESVIQPGLTNQVSSSVPDAHPTSTATIDVDSPSADKVATKRKPEDEPSEGVKRRRTISVGSTSSGCSDSESQPATAAVAKSCSPEPQPSKLPLPPMASALENILNVPSDSDEDVVESMEDEDRAGGSRGRREQSNYSLTAIVNEDDHSSDAGMMPPMEPRPASKSPPMFPMLAPNPSFCATNFGMFLSATPEIPEANTDTLRMIRRDPVRSIHIDGISREIRHYGSTAVTFLNWDDPRQISFYNGLRRIIIDNDVEIPCYLNGPDVEYKLYGVYHRFRLGAPTRELYIDGIGYECYFDGSPKKIRIGNLYRSVRLTGGPPRVHIGQKKRQDLVAGKIDIIIDEEHASPVYLDAKPQTIYVNGIPFIIMFIDSLKRVLINDVPFRTAFGGLAQSFKFKNKVFSFRFDRLPAGIVPGAVSIFQMIMTKLPSPPPLPPSLRYCEELPTIYTPPTVPSIPNYSVPSIDTKLGIVPENAPSELKPPPMNSLLENVNIEELFQKLVESGIVQSPHHSDEPESKPNIEPKKPVEHNTVHYVDFSKPGTLRQKQPALVSKLYSGIQCGSCGLRFPQEQTVKYSQHLDWHFRLNRRGKDGARMIHSRKWYYNSADWMQFQEMEDKSERGTSWFESQAATEYTEKEEEEVPCVSAGENSQDAVCVLCQDKFDQFYNQDIEEWQLRNAIRVDGILYHPTCYQDHTERKDDHSDIEEIVDLEEPISVDDSTPVEELSINLLENQITEAKVDSPVVDENLVDENNTDLNNIVTINDDSIVIKQEKLDAPKSTGQINDIHESITTNEETSATPADAGRDTECEDDSDIEEVQLIEQPIEEIIINDDINDLEPNLETLNVEDIIAVQKEVDSLPEETAVEVEPVEIADKVVDITSVPNVATIDGNIELGDSLQVVSTGTKIKLNIVKPVTHNEEKSHSPKATSNEVEPVSDTEMDDLLNGPPKELTTINAQPLPPGEELVTAADIKPKLKERKLTECLPVTKGTETSGLCSIM